MCVKFRNYARCIDSIAMFRQPIQIPQRQVMRLLQLRFDFVSTTTIAIKTTIQLQFNSSRQYVNEGTNSYQTLYIENWWKGYTMQRWQSKDATWCWSVGVNAILITVMYTIASLCPAHDASTRLTNERVHFSSQSNRSRIEVELQSNRNCNSHLSSVYEITLKPIQKTQNTIH